VERAEIESLVAEGEDAVAAVIVELEARIAELEARLGQNSRNSSRPPSSDGYSKPAAKRSLRRRSGRAPGGQPGAPGHHLKRVEDPDERVVHEPQGCGGCGAGLADAEALEDGERRQVFDLPEDICLRVVEHVAERRRCCCGHVTAGSFPAGVGAPAQYGTGLRALGVYLVVHQHLPYERACQLLGELAAANVSTGTLKAWVGEAAGGRADFTERLRALLAAAPVVHFDETGGRIEGALGWIHSASTAGLTLYAGHAKRGCEGIDAAGVMPRFKGTAVHDGWAPYRRYEDATHALCNGHHLRELAGVSEREGEAQPWAPEMAELLCEINRAVDDAKAAGRSRLDRGALAAYEAGYERIVASGREQNPEPTERSGRRGPKRRSKTANLLRRLDSQRAEALRFASDFRVPFTNNQAEQDIRMVKLQQKISGCWRTREGARSFLALRSYTSTARKQGERPLAVLARLAAGRPWLPMAAGP